MMGREGSFELKPASLVIVGNLPEKTKLTFANSIKGARIKFNQECKIRRVVILDTPTSLEANEERSKVIRSILGTDTFIISVPCIDDFRIRAFEILAEELKRKDVQTLIVDITNGRKEETFDLIISTSICRINNVIITTIPSDFFNTPYDEIEDHYYATKIIRSFSQERSLESAAQFELIYYSDKIDECVSKIKSSESEIISRSANEIKEKLSNAIINYFSNDGGNLENTLRILSEIHESIATKLAYEVSGGKFKGTFYEANQFIEKELSKPAQDTSIPTGEEFNKELLAAATLADLFDYCRKVRNYLAHPNHRKIEVSDAQLMIFATLTLLDNVTTTISGFRQEQGKKCL